MTTNVPSLEGTPYKAHVHLISCPEDKDVHESIRRRLVSVGLAVFDCEYLKGDLKEKTEAAIHDSRRVVFLCSPDYKKYDKSTLEISIARDRAESITTDDILVVLLSGMVGEDLRVINLDFTSRVLKYEDNDFDDLLKNHIVQDNIEKPELRPNLGAAVAYSYYFGYLKFVLPELDGRLRKLGFMKGLENPNDRNMSSQFFVVIPETLKGLPALSAMDDRITDYDKVSFRAARGGHPLRDYSTPIHKMRNDEGEIKELLFAAEIPSILVNIYDMAESGITGINQRRKSMEIRQFYHYLRDLLESDPACKGKVTFIFHSDQIAVCHQPIGDVILHAIRGAITDQLNSEAKAAGKAQASATESVKETDTLKNVVLLLKDKYRIHPLSFYQMKGEKLGKALIINNRNFDAAASLKTRAGSERDEETMMDLLKEMKFETTVMKDLTKAQMMDLACQWAADPCHRDAQAFVCVLMSHGVSGKLRGTDGELVRFVDFAEIIGRCSALKGKPKLFFVEASQDEPVTPDVEADKGITQEPEPEDNLKRLTPTVADCLCSFSSLPGTKAFRDRQKGSVYIQSLADHIKEHKEQMDLELMLKEVTRDIRTKTQEKQNPFYVSTIDKLVRLDA